MNCNANVFSIFLGNAKTMTLKALYSVSFTPLDLTSCSEIDIAIPNADGTFLHLLLTLSQVAITSPAVLGQFTAPITSDQSALFMVGELQNFDVTFTISGDPMTVRYAGALSVFEVG